MTTVKFAATETNKDVKQLKTDVNRIENKLDGTLATVDEHTVRIKKLEPKTA